MMMPLAKIMFDYNIKRYELHNKVDEISYVPVSKDAITNIKNNKDAVYTTSTLIRICRALSLITKKRITPNDIIFNPERENGEWS